MANHCLSYIYIVDLQSRFCPSECLHQHRGPWYIFDQTHTISNVSSLLLHIKTATQPSKEQPNYEKSIASFSPVTNYKYLCAQKHMVQYESEGYSTSQSEIQDLKHSC